MKYIIYLNYIFLSLFVYDSINTIMYNDSTLIKPLFKYLEDINNVVLKCVLDYFITFRYCWLIFIGNFTYLMNDYFYTFRFCWDRTFFYMAQILNVYIIFLDIIIFRITQLHNVLIVYILTQFLLKLR